MHPNTIAISVDDKPLFTWEGDESAVKNILEAVPRAAKHVGLDVQSFAGSCLSHLVAGGKLLSDPIGQEMQMMTVIWAIVTQSTNNPKHPGKIGDYVATTDIDIDLHLEGGKVVIDVNATGKLDS